MTKTLLAQTITGAILLGAAGLAPVQAKTLCAAPQTQCIAQAPSYCLQEPYFSQAPAQADASCSAAYRELRACLDRLVVACGPGHSAGPFPLSGTVYEGDTADGDHYVMRFEADGVVDYDSPTGHWRTGRWIQVGDEVVISMNSGYAVYFGLADPVAMTGQWVNQVGNRTTWRFEAGAGKPLFRREGENGLDAGRSKP